MKEKNHVLAFVALAVILVFISGCTTTGNIITKKTANTCNTPSCNEVTENSQTDFVVIPLSEITGTVKHYEYNSNGAVIRYFIVLDSKGNVETAFDACEVCGGEKGYRQERSDVVCNNCGRHFKIDELGETNTNEGGCWPAHIEHEIINGNVVIKNSELETGRRYFV